MKTAELKLKLFRYIDSLDEHTLTYVYNLFFEKENDFWNELTDFQKDDIKAGLSDLKNGKRKKIEDTLLSLKK